MTEWQREIIGCGVTRCPIDLDLREELHREAFTTHNPKPAQVSQRLRIERHLRVVHGIEEKS